MILLAADYVGMKIVEWFISIHETIDVLIYDSEDHGGTKDAILNLAARQKQAIQVYSSEKFRTKEVRDKLKFQNHEFGVLGWWPYILKQEEIQITKRGFINTHPAYLPYNRGKHPYFWSIVDETKFGVSIHWITESIDDGAVIGQEEIVVSWLDTGGSLYDKAREEMVELFKTVYFQVKEKRDCPVIQNESISTFHYGKELEPCSCLQLDNSYTFRQVINVLRGRMFGNKGMAHFVDGGKKYYISIDIREEI